MEKKRTIEEIEKDIKINNDIGFIATKSHDSDLFDKCLERNITLQEELRDLR